MGAVCRNFDEFRPSSAYNQKDFFFGFSRGLRAVEFRECGFYRVLFLPRYAREYWESEHSLCESFGDGQGTRVAAESCRHRALVQGRVVLDDSDSARFHKFFEFLFGLGANRSK